MSCPVKESMIMEAQLNLFLFSFSSSSVNLFTAFCYIFFPIMKMHLPKRVRLKDDALRLAED